MVFPECSNKRERCAKRAEEPREDTNGHTLTDKMELKQVFVFLLSLAVCMCVHACYDEENLENAARKKLQSHYHQPAFPTQASSAPSSCPLDLYEKDKTLKGRSISPWAYVQKQMPGHFPSTYYEAKCLCSGCILLDDEDEPYESSSYSSAPVIQSRLFLKRELCEGHRGNGTRYSLKPVNKDVTVACTCVQPIVIMAP